MSTTIERTIHRYFLEHDLFFKSPVDNYLKWMPLFVPLVADLTGLKTHSSIKKQLLVISLAEAARYLTTDSLKKITLERRPAPFVGRHSFPSGHTSSSFTSAEFMHQELKDKYPIFSCLGYLAATSVAVIRLVKNKHWLRDVLAGAAIGIITMKVAYAVTNYLQAKLEVLDSEQK
jgi:membrane-associated phospholipid phosphatase